MTALQEPAHLLTARRELFIYRAGLVAQLAAVDAVAVDLDRLIESLASPALSTGEAVPAPLTAVAAVVESTPPQGEGTAPGTPMIVESSASPERGDAVPEFGRADGAAPATRRAARKVPQQTKTCPDCGKVCGNATGLAAHRRHNHPAPKHTAPLGPLAASVATSTPSAPLSPAAFPSKLSAVSSGRLPDGRVLACTEKGCGHESGSIRELIAHTTDRHDRAPYNEEKFPVQASGVPA